jgi:hypothetical protein
MMTLKRHSAQEIHNNYFQYIGDHLEVMHDLRTESKLIKPKLNSFYISVIMVKSVKLWNDTSDSRYFIYLFISLKTLRLGKNIYRPLGVHEVVKTILYIDSYINATN